MKNMITITNDQYNKAKNLFKRVGRAGIKRVSTCAGMSLNDTKELLNILVKNGYIQEEKRVNQHIMFRWFDY